MIRQIDAGADAVQIFGSWAGVLPPASFERWVPGLAMGVAALRDALAEIVAALRGRSFVFNLGHGVVPRDAARELVEELGAASVWRVKTRGEVSI